MITRPEAEPTRLVAFDYDGTASIDSHPIGPEVEQGIQTLWRSDISTTVITGKPFQRLKQVCGNVGRLVSDGIPFATERGGRIVSGDHCSNAAYTPLEDDELAEVLNVAKHGLLQCLTFHPRDLRSKAYIWFPSDATPNRMPPEFVPGSTIVDSKISALREALHVALPCLVMVRHSEDQLPEEEMPRYADLNAIWTPKNVTITHKGVNKQTALQAVCELSDIDIGSTVFAGNDHHDLPLLNDTRLQERILVGPSMIDCQEPITRLPDPAALGSYFEQIARRR